MSVDKKRDDDMNRLSGAELLKFMQGVSEHAEKEVSRVGFYYKLAAGCLTVIVAVGMGFTYKEGNEIRKERADQRKEIKDEIERQEKQMHDRQASLFSQMQTNLLQQVSVLGQKVEKKVDEEFKTERITALVTDKAEKRIDAIADPIITEKISKTIQPKIDDADKSLQQIKGEMQAARCSLQSVQDQADFLTVVTAAQNDDRLAFDKLQKWAKDPHFLRQADANAALEKIIDDHNYTLLALEGGYEPKKMPVGDLSKLSFETVQARYFETEPVEDRLQMLEYIWGRADFSMRQKMGLMIEVMKRDKSLRAVELSSKLFQIESKQKVKRLLINEVIDWWEKNEGTISDKPVRK